MRFPDHIRVRVPGKICVYCGMPANSIEHFPPASVGSAGWLLPACKECNFLAGTLHPQDFVKRSEAVKAKLSARYPPRDIPDIETMLTLGEPEWNTALKDLNYMRARSLRLAWSAVRYLSLIGQHKVFAGSRVKTDTTTRREQPLGKPIEAAEELETLLELNGWDRENRVQELFVCAARQWLRTKEDFLRAAEQLRLLDPAKKAWASREGAGKTFTGPPTALVPKPPVKKGPVPWQKVP